MGILGLDAHETPPTALRDVYKKYQKIKLDDLSSDLDVLDFQRIDTLTHVKSVGAISSGNLQEAFERFAGQDVSKISIAQDASIYESTSLPGLLLIPALLPSSIQEILLSRLLHRDLSDPRHKTNLHLHYDIPYLGQQKQQKPEHKHPEDASFFAYRPSSKIMFQPKAPHIHRPLPISKVLEKSLRWVTLGGQYDWTNKVYPSEEPPEFPPDIARMLEAMFPDMKAQAAIVNFYSPGDTLSLHRDVSEETDKGLVSISMGCDCLFVVALGSISTKPVVVHLRSGDAVFMSRHARFAWHGVPRIIPNSCPLYLQTWPAEDGKFEEWADWMKNKRINLNVRQMRD